MTFFVPLDFTVYLPVVIFMNSSRLECFSFRPFLVPPIYLHLSSGVLDKYLIDEVRICKIPDSHLVKVIGYLKIFRNRN
jgi:hypothetical protein